LITFTVAGGAAKIGCWKRVIGPKLKAHNFPDQKTETRIGTSILNFSKGQREPHVQHNCEADDLW
jgi:hypothetical protein